MTRGRATRARQGSRSIVVTADQIAQLGASYRVAYKRDAPARDCRAVVGTRYPDRPTIRDMSATKCQRRTTDDPSSTPLSDHARTCRRTLNRATTSRSRKVSRRTTRSARLGELQDQRLDVLLHRKIETRHTLTVEDILGLSMPAEAEPPMRSLASGRRRRLEDLRGSTCFLPPRVEWTDRASRSRCLPTKRNLPRNLARCRRRAPWAHRDDRVCTVSRRCGGLVSCRRCARVALDTRIDALALRLSLTCDPSRAFSSPIAIRLPAEFSHHCAPLSRSVSFSPDPDPEAW